MKDVMLIFVLTVSIRFAGLSQVKETFRDSANTSTIVVIKEDGGIDQELLNKHFDLDDLSMNEQIMITTSPEPLPIEEATASIDEDIEIFFDYIEEEKINEEDAAEANPSVSNIDTQNTAKNSLIDTKKEKIATPSNAKSTVRGATTRAKGNYPSKSSFKVKKAAQKKYYSKSKIRKKKNKKRNQFKRKGSKSCYSF